MSNAAASTLTAAPGEPGKLDSLMMAMDVVDTLRHREDLVARELNDVGKEEALLAQLRNIYRAQGIEVPDSILRDGVKALRESRFTYVAPPDGLQRKLALAYVNRGRYGRRLLAIVAAIGIGLGGYWFGVVQPQRQAAEAARIELTETLPRQLASGETEIRTLTTLPEALARAGVLKADGEAALRAGDRAGAAQAVAEMRALRDRLAQEYTLTIVSRPGADSGVWRRPPRNPLGRNHYLIVEAIGRDGRPIPLPIRNEETGQTETVTIFGVRVPQEMFERIGRDKRDDGIVQLNRFGVKRRGQLEPDYLMPYEGGMITRW